MYIEIAKKIFSIFNFKNVLFSLIDTIFNRLCDLNSVELRKKVLDLYISYFEECAKFYNEFTLSIVEGIIKSLSFRYDFDENYNKLAKILKREKMFNNEYGYIEDPLELLIERKNYIKLHPIKEYNVELILSKNSFHVDSQFLNTYAENLCEKEYITNPAIKRENEITNLELILVSPKKSPLLIGEAGVGKTAIVEGLAYNIINNNVPNLLKEKKIFKITSTNLVKGCSYVGDTQERFDNLISELKKHKDVIIFIDEIHTIVGAGAGSKSNLDISNMLKPFIDRGEVKVIGSTTLSEYKKYIHGDKALVRRFFNIEIQEPSIEDTISILYDTIPQMEALTLVKNDFSKDTMYKIINYIVKICDIKNQDPNLLLRRPELPLTILEMAFSYSALRSTDKVSLEDFINSILITPSLDKEKRKILANNLKNEI